MRVAVLWFAAAILVGLVAAVFDLPFNGAVGFLLVTLWLIGAWRLATVSTDRSES